MVKLSKRFARHLRRFAMGRVLIIMIVVLAALGGCGSDQSETSLSESITETTWKSADGNIVEFREDGTFGISAVEFVDVSSANREWGAWELEGSVLTITPDEDSPYAAGKSGSYTIAIADDGNRLDLTVEEDSWVSRLEDFSQGLTRAE
jgi:hypothetical protein